MEGLRTCFVEMQIRLTTKLALAEGYLRYSVQTQRLHVARPWHKTPLQSISDTSSWDAATDSVRRRAKAVLDRHDSTQAGQAGTVACSVVKHERLKLLVNL